MGTGAGTRSTHAAPNTHLDLKDTKPLTIRPLQIPLLTHR